jgi:hypothetical protein
MSTSEAAVLHWIVLAVLLAAFVGAVVVPFAIGLTQGPPGPAHPGAVTRTTSQPMRPLGRVAGIYGRFMLLYLVLATISVWSGYYGGNRRGAICVNTGYPVTDVSSLGVTVKHGVSASAIGNVQACALHPSSVQWVLFLLTKLPGPALLVCVLLLIWQLIRQASDRGPLTWRAAAIMWRLGWVVLAGTAAAAALGALGTDLLTRMLMTSPTYGAAGTAVDVLLAAPVRALVPVAALAGAALLTFARITRAGAAMDEELKAIV